MKFQSSKHNLIMSLVILMLMCAHAAYAAMTVGSYQVTLTDVLLLGSEILALSPAKSNSWVQLFANVMARFAVPRTQPPGESGG